MLEAVTKPWQVIATEAGTRRMSFMKAASELGVGIFASGPLGQGQVLQNSKIKASLTPFPPGLHTPCRA